MIKELNKIYNQYLFRPNNKKVLDYINNRGISVKTINKFQIGYCNYNVGYKTLSKKYSDKELVDSNLFILNKKGKVIDLFFKRITIPITYKNEIKFFTSRAYPDDNLYKHLHQTGDIEYAFNMEALDKNKYVIIVEGPFDCMTLDQNGFSSIGLLGAHRITRTIINELQGKIVYIAFDKEPNGTGDKASLTLAQKLVNHNIRPKIINLPFNGEKIDINSYFQNHNVNNFGNLIKDAENVTFKKIEKKQYSNKKNNYDIIRIAQQYLKLYNSNGKYKAVCPFHEDTAPSLVFYPESNSFYCFGCNIYGNAVRFKQLIEEKLGNKLSYKQIEETLKE